jgi:hypothetical protein
MPTVTVGISDPMRADYPFSASWISAARIIGRVLAGDLGPAAEKAGVDPQRTLHQGRPDRSAADEYASPRGRLRNCAAVPARRGIRRREPARQQGNRAHAAQLTAANGPGREWPHHEPRSRCSGIKRTGDTRFPVIARIRVRKTGPPCARSCRHSPPSTVTRHLPTPAQRTSTRQRNARSSACG